MSSQGRTILLDKAIRSAENGRPESFAEYIELYWQARKRFQYSYDSKVLEGVF